jgi:hypothetical protein
MAGHFIQTRLFGFIKKRKESGKKGAKKRKESGKKGANAPFLGY